MGWLQVMKGVEPFLQQALEKVHQLKEAEVSRSKALEATIDTHRGDLVRRRAAADSADASASHHSFPTPRAGEPTQMTSAPLLPHSMPISNACLQLVMYRSCLG